jgi:hypothetical protein
MSKNKKKKRQTNAPNKFIAFVKKTLFGEQLRTAIANPISKEPGASPVFKNEELAAKRGQPKQTVEQNHVSDGPLRTPTEPSAAVSPEYLNVPLDPEEISKFRKRMESRFAESLKAKSPLIRLGIDLGTSSSKVVCRGESTAFPVCFGRKSQDLSSYLIPSLVAFDGERVKFGFHAISGSASAAISNFKMCLACSSQESGGCGLANCSLTHWPFDQFTSELEGQEAQFVCAFYLAKLVALTKEIVLKKLSKSFRARPNPKWVANLAVPETFIEQSRVADAFRMVLRTAWFMSEIFLEEPSLENRKPVFECFRAAQQLASESMQFDDNRLSVLSIQR